MLLPAFLSEFEGATEGESKDPEDIFPTMPRQGILTTPCFLSAAYNFFPKIPSAKRELLKSWHKGM
jgi:hypothetical protein